MLKYYFLDEDDVRVETVAYLDEDGFKVEIGTIMGMNEHFCPCRGNGCESGCSLYMVVRLPDRANMVELVEVLPTWDEDGIITQMRTVEPIQVISLEPWKVGAI